MFKNSLALGLPIFGGLFFDAPDDGGNPPEPDKSLISSDPDKSLISEPASSETEAVALEALKIPKGQTWDEESTSGFLSLINDSKLSKVELAQKLVDMYAAQYGKHAEGLSAEAKRIDDELKMTETEWRNTALKDKEYGGEAWKANQRFIAAGRDKLSTPGAVEVLETYGLGNHPEIVRMFYRAGKLLGEDAGPGKDKGQNQTVSPSEDGLVEMYRKSLKGVEV